MATSLPSDGNSARIRRVPKPSAQVLRDPSLALPFQRTAADEFLSAEAAKAAEAANTSVNIPPVSADTASSSAATTPVASDSEPDSPVPTSAHSKRAYIEDADDDDDNPEVIREVINPTGECFSSHWSII